MRRFLIVVLILLLLLPLIAAVAVQIVLTTDLPRRMVLEQLENDTGLAFDADTLTTGWRGRSSLTNLTATLPLEDQPLLAIPRLDVSHADLLRLLIFRSLKLNEVRAHKPVIIARERQIGGWNIIEAAEIIRRRRSRQSDQGGELELPELAIREATVKVVRADGTTLTYQPLSIQGEPVANGAWAFNLSLPPHADLEGRIAPAAFFRHELSFELRQLSELLQPWLEEPPPALAARGSWSGRMTAGSVTGRLDLEEATVGETGLSGAVHISAADHVVTARPEEVIVRHPALKGETMRIMSGLLTADKQNVQMRKIRLAGLETTARLDGRWDLSRQRGEAELSWRGEISGRDISHRGDLTVSVRKPDDGPLTVDGRSVAHVKASDRLEATVEATWSGSPAEAMTAGITLARIDLPDAEGFDLDGASVDLRLQWPLVFLRDLDVPQAVVTQAQGRMNLETREWSVELAAAKLTAPKVTGPFQIELVASGDLQTIDFSALDVTHEHGRLLAAGTYSFASEPPLQARASLNVDMPQNASAGAQSATEGPGGDVGATARGHLARQLKAELEVRGSIQPLDLNAVGDLVAIDFPVGDGVIHRLDLPCEAHVDAEQATLRSSEFTAFDGRWSLLAELDLDDRDLAMDLTLQQASLRDLSALLAAEQQLAGEVSATINLRLPRLKPDLLQLQGDWSVTELQADAFAADSGSGRFQTRAGKVFVEDIELHRGEGRLTGTLSFGLRENGRLGIDVSVRDWPWQPTGAVAHLRVGGDADVTVDIHQKTAEGSVNLGANITYQGQDLGQVSVAGSARGRSLTIETLEGTAFGGTVEGSGHISIDEWRSATGTVSWHDLDLAQLATLLPDVDELTGESSGSITVAESDDRKSPEPVRIEVKAEATDGAWRGLEIGGFEMLAFLGPQRFMVDRSSFALAGGSVEIWGRTTQHNGDRHAHAFLVLNDLQLQQFVRAIDPESEPIPGVVNGRLSAGGYVHPPHRTFGTGTLELTKSDLAPFPPIEAVYNTLQLDFSKREASGEGTVQLQLEDESLIIKRFEYFNRGTNIVGSGEIMSIWRAGESPVEAVVVGSVLPFHNLDLPVISDLDRLIATLQADATSVRVSGTLTDYEVQVIPFAEIGSTVQRMLKASLSGS